METSQFQIKAQEFGPKALLVALFVVSVFSSTSFAAEVKMSPKKSCAGEAEPNFFHVDKSGFEDTELMFQDSEFGPSLNLGPDFQLFYNASSAQDRSQNPNATNKGRGGWCIIAKNPSALGEIGKDRKPGEAICGLGRNKEGQDTSGDGTHNLKDVSLNVGGKKMTLTIQETKSGGKVTDTKMFIKGDGDVRLRLNPEINKKGSRVSSKLQVDALSTKSGKPVGRTEAHVEGTINENAQDSTAAKKFLSCENKMKTGKQAKSKYRIPKYTKDLNGDHHIIGANQGPNNQFIYNEQEDHASYRQKSNGTPDTPIRKLATR